MDTRKLLFIILVVLTTLPGAYAQSRKYSPAHIGFVYPLSTNGRQAKEYSNSFSLHVLAGVSGAETGIALAGLSLVIADSASGLQASGFSNHVFNKARGVRLAGFMNIVRNRAEGFQAAGFMNLTGASKGASFAGFANITRDSALGFQAAGFINTSGNTGTQVAGFINIAKKVKGVQVAGFINVADSSEYPIGLVNIIRNGERSFSVSTDETLTSLVTFRSGSRKLYGIIGVGYNDKKNENLYAWEAGLGAHFQLARNFRINTEAVTIGLTDFKSDDYYRASLRVLPALRFGRHVEFFAGPTFNYVRSENGKGAGLVNHYVWSEKEASGLLHGLYFGATGGINIIL